MSALIQSAQIGPEHHERIASDIVERLREDARGGKAYHALSDEAAAEIERLRASLAEKADENEQLREELVACEDLVGAYDKMTDRAEAAEAENERLREALASIQRTTSPGTRTLNDFIRDMGWANDTARTALERNGEKP